MTTVTTGTGLLPPDTAQRSIDVQAQIRRNAEEHGDALRELLEWEESMKIRDAANNNLKKQQKNKVRRASSGSDTGVKEAVGSEQKEERTAEDKQLKNLVVVDNQQSGTDDDKIGGVVSNTCPSPSALILPGSESENIPDNDTDKSVKDIANDERQKGNACYARGNFDDAIKCYTTCLQYDPQSAVAYSNRAMAHLKKKDWTKAEDDANSALAIDPAHIKSYQRRSAARAALGKLRSALVDLSHAEMEASKQDDGGSGGSGKGGGGIQKSIASEKRRVETLLKAAMKRAPRRTIPIVMEKVTEGGTCDETQKDDVVDLQSEKQDDDGMEQELEQEQPTTVPNPESENGKEIFVADSGNDEPQLIIEATTTLPATSRTRKYKKPTTWYEFEATWRSLGSQLERRSFLATIKPKRLAALYRNGIEDVDLLVEIVSVAADIAEGSADYIDCMAGTKCIDIPVMMMTEEHKMIVREAIEKSFGGDARRDGCGAIVMSKLGC